MSEQKTAFEAWYDNDISEPLPDDYTILGKRYLYMGWCAATAEANKRMVELESEVAELKAELKSEKEHSNILLKNGGEFYRNELALKAHINTLREALEKLKNEVKHELNVSFVADIDKSLSATPAQSLQSVINETIEKCAKVCDEDAKQSREFAEPFAARCAELLAEAIRALKGTQ